MDKKSEGLRPLHSKKSPVGFKCGRKPNMPDVDVGRTIKRILIFFYNVRNMKG